MIISEYECAIKTAEDTNAETPTQRNAFFLPSAVRSISILITEDRRYGIIIKGTNCLRYLQINSEKKIILYVNK